MGGICEHRIHTGTNLSLKRLPFEVSDFEPQCWICHHDLACRQTDEADVVALNNRLAVSVLQAGTIYRVYDL